MIYFYVLMIGFGAGLVCGVLLRGSDQQVLQDAADKLTQAKRHEKRAQECLRQVTLANAESIARDRRIKTAAKT